MTDLERQILDRCADELGAPAGLMAEEFGVSTGAITKAAKALAAQGLLRDTGWAMKKRRDGNWDWIESKKEEGGMTSRPGASTVWRTTDAGVEALNINQEYVNDERTGSLSGSAVDRFDILTRTQMKLTDNEKKVLLAIARSEYQNGTDAADLIGHHVWSEFIADNAGISKRSVAGVFSSLSKKGLIETYNSYGQNEDTVALTAAGVEALPKEESMAKAKRKGTARRAPDPTPEELVEVAGFDYATDQIGSDYFHDWVRDQLIEASKMPPDQVLPLETKADARTIARKMLQQLEWDTKREVSGKDGAFWEGFHRACEEARDGLADELLEMNREMRSGARVGEDRRRGYHGSGSSRSRSARLTHATATPGTRVRVVDGDSMYRGEVGRIVTPDANRLVHLDNYNRNFLKHGGVLVERRNGSLFVVPPHVLERENENPIDRKKAREVPREAPRRVQRGSRHPRARA